MGQQRSPFPATAIGHRVWVSAAGIHPGRHDARSRHRRGAPECGRSYPPFLYPHVVRRSAFGISDCCDGTGKSEQTLPRLIIQRQQQMRFFAMHQTKAEKRFFPALLPVIPYGIDDLYLIQLSDRDYIVSKVLIPNDHVVQYMACREQQEIEPTLIFIPFGEKLIDMAA